MRQILDCAPVVDKDGWLEGAWRVPSPNHDARPEDTPPSLVVVHGISLPPGEYGGPWIERFFTNSLPADGHPYFEGIHDRRVSAHLLVRRDGGLVQFVPFTLRAWHAGESCWNGRQACNDFSIGLELEGTDDEPYADTQYTTLAGVIRALCIAYPGITEDGVVGHSDIAPGRKTDPGETFDWQRLRRLVAG